MLGVLGVLARDAKQRSLTMPELEIRLNGETVHVPSGSTVADLVRQLELPGDRVAVELDRRIIRRPDWPLQLLQAGAAVEIVQIVGGG